MVDYLRDDKGRFLPGTPVEPGPGRPPKKTEEQIVDMLASIFDEETSAELVKQMREQLKRGHVKTLREILPYLAPKKEKTEVTGPNGEPLYSIADIIAAMSAAQRQNDDGKPGNTG